MIFEWLQLKAAALSSGDFRRFEKRLFSYIKQVKSVYASQSSQKVCVVTSTRPSVHTASLSIFRICGNF